MRGFRKEKAVLWKETVNVTTAYSPGELVVFLLCTFAALSALMYAGLSMLGNMMPEVTLSFGGAAVLAMELMVFTAVYEFLLPFLESKRGTKGESKRHPLIAVAGILLGAVALRWYYSRNAEELGAGYRYIISIFVQKYNAHFDTAVSCAPGNMKYAGSALFLFAVALVFFLWNISYLTKKKWCFLILPGGIWAFLMLVGKTPGWKSMVFFCLGLYGICCLNDRTGRVGRYKRMPGTAGPGRMQRMLPGMVGMAAISAILIAVSLLGPAYADNWLGKREQLDQAKTKLEERFKEVGQNLSNFEFVLNRKTIKESETADVNREVCVLTMSDRPTTNLYLKSFQGTYYQNGSWSEKDGTFTFEALKAGISAERVQRLLSQGVYDAAHPTQRTTYSTEYKSLLGNAMFMPYFVDVAGIEADDLKGDMFLSRAKVLGKQTLQGVRFNEMNTSQLHQFSSVSYEEKDQQAWDWYDEFVKERYTEVPENMPFVDIYAGYVDSNVLIHHRDFSNEERLLYASKVGGLMSGFQYTLSPGEVPENWDAVEYFLGRNHKGFCVHFASAGVLILRKLGIPARYCDGYMVPTEDLVHSEGEYHVTVKDKHAHAWAEIYLDHIGWVPVEMTAGRGSTYTGDEPELSSQESQEPSEPHESSEASEASSESASASSEDTQSSASEQAESSTSSAVGETQTSSSESHTESSKPAPLGSSEETGESESEAEVTFRMVTVLAAIGRFLLKFLIAVLVLGAIYYFVRSRIREYYRIVETEMRRRRYRSLVLRINRRIYKGLRRTGAIKASGAEPTDADYEKALKEKYSQFSEETWEEYMRIVKKAAFGKTAVTGEEAKVCYDLYHSIALRQSK